MKSDGAQHRKILHRLEAYRSLILNLSHAMGLSGLDAHDIATETFGDYLLYVIKHGEDAVRHRRAWICAVARNKIADRMKQKIENLDQVTNPLHRAMTRGMVSVVVEKDCTETQELSEWLQSNDLRIRRLLTPVQTEAYDAYKCNGSVRGTSKTIGRPTKQIRQIMKSIRKRVLKAINHRKLPSPPQT